MQRTLWRTHLSHNESYKQQKQTFADNLNATGKKQALGGLGQAGLLNALSFDLAQLTVTATPGL